MADYPTGQLPKSYYGQLEPSIDAEDLARDNVEPVLDYPTETELPDHFYRRNGTETSPLGRTFWADFAAALAWHLGRMDIVLDAYRSYPGRDEVRFRIGPPKQSHGGYRRPYTLVLVYTQEPRATEKGAIPAVKDAAARTPTSVKAAWSLHTPHTEKPFTGTLEMPWSPRELADAVAKPIHEQVPGYPGGADLPAGALTERVRRVLTGVRGAALIHETLAPGRTIEGTYHTEEGDTPYLIRGTEQNGEEYSFDAGKTWAATHARAMATARRRSRGGNGNGDD